jgi:hypothetical protein
LLEHQPAGAVNETHHDTPARIGILSDIHYAGAAERARGNDYEYREIQNPFLRQVVRVHRRYVWLRNPLDRYYLLDRFLERSGPFDYVVGLGDYSCDSKCVGLSDDAALESARECVEKLRHKFGARFRGCVGDHELGKFSLVGERGGLRLGSWRRACELGLEPFWRIDFGDFVLMGITSSLVTLPTMTQEMLPDERAEWERLRQEHLAVIRAAFAELGPQRKVLLFCHDPTALPFLWREEIIRARVRQVAATIIGHLHSQLILRLSGILSGMPVLNAFGHSIGRLSAALSQARDWRPFNVRLCPSLAGIELLKDGGYYSLSLQPFGQPLLRFQWHPIPR